jgi:hypothetical protein
MRPARQTRIAGALGAAVAIFGCAAAAGVAASASGRAVVSLPLVTPTDSGSIPCPTHSCAITIPSPSRTSFLTVHGMELPAASAPPAARATPADKGRLTWNRQSDHSLTCDGYAASDPTSFQFYLGQSTLGNVLYSITYKVKSTHPKQAQLCLGARFQFAGARRVTLPNGLPGFVGVLPPCRPDDLGQRVACLISRTQSAPYTLLNAQLPAIGGDPWVRS